MDMVYVCAHSCKGWNRLEVCEIHRGGLLFSGFECDQLQSDMLFIYV